MSDQATWEKYYEDPDGARYDWSHHAAIISFDDWCDTLAAEVCYETWSTEVYGKG